MLGQDSRPSDRTLKCSVGARELLDVLKVVELGPGGCAVRTGKEGIHVIVGVKLSKEYLPIAVWQQGGAEDTVVGTREGITAPSSTLNSGLAPTLKP